MAKPSTPSKMCCNSKVIFTYILGSRLLSDFSSIQQNLVAMKDYTMRRGKRRKAI